MKVWCVISVCLLIVGALSGVAECSLGQVTLPNYQEGNHWTYSANMTYSPGFVLIGTLKMEMGERESIQVNSTLYTTLRNDILGNGSFAGVYQGFNVSGNWTMVGLENWDLVSLEIVKSEITIVFRGVLEMGTSLSFFLRIQNTTSSRVTQDSWHHPYDVGDTGDTILARTSSESMLVEIEGSPPINSSTNWSGSVTVTYSCIEYAEITVPAGVFQTHHIQRTESNGLIEDNYYSQEVGAGVLIERSIGGILKIGEWELLSYSYSESQSSVDEGLPLLYWLVPVTGVILLILAAFYLERRPRH